MISTQNMIDLAAASKEPVPREVLLALAKQWSEPSTLTGNEMWDCASDACARELLRVMGGDDD